LIIPVALKLESARDPALRPSVKSPWVAPPTKPSDAQGHTQENASLAMTPGGEGGSSPVEPVPQSDEVQPTRIRVDEVKPPQRPSPSETTEASPFALDPPLESAVETPAATTRRIRVQTETGRAVVARIHGSYGGEVRVILPDGQLGEPQVMVYTDEPFRPSTADEMRQELLAGPFAGFQVRQSAHYLVLYRSTTAFADASVRLLEELYRGLTEAFRKRDIPVHDPEFPLVAIIFRTEKEFRSYRQVDPDVQAYYEIYTNRIYFYQESERDQQSPEAAAMRKPQTVAHEGTHQILQNVGIQSRLSAWPLWLVEGLAEYCAAPVTTRKGVGWKGLGIVNPLHMATIRDLEDPLSLEVMSTARPKVGRDPGAPLVEYLVTRTRLTPTDYALSWALTHYLALKRGNEFIAYLKTISQLPPLKKVTPEEHLATFRAAFGNDLARMDRAVASYLSKLKGYDQLPYYAVMFEQRVGQRMIKRAAIVSQSPSMIRQWLETVQSVEGAPPNWEAVPHPTRARAVLTAEQWMRSP
jgi:hypothetical protein